MKERVPIREGVIKGEGKESVLTGNKCKACGQIFFPPASLCLSCLNDELEVVELSKKGTLFSYSISYMPTVNWEPPYAAGWIKLPEGIIFFSPIKDWEEKGLKVGQEMELSVEKLWEEEEKEVIGYKFKPVS
jgi:benzoylsuccinyl-CoA thiolase BbsA subunit